MIIANFQIGPIGTNSFLIANKNEREQILIDVPPGSFEIIKIEDYNNLKILITHGHWDHTTDAYLFQKKGAKIYAHKNDSFLINNPESMRFTMTDNLHIEPVKIDFELQDNMILNLLNENFLVLHTPGHTPGGCSFYSEKLKCVFTGDTLFCNSIGRTDLPGSDYKEISNSIIKKLYSLPEETKIYPGHGPFSSIKKEKTTNPYFRM